MIITLLFYVDVKWQISQKTSLFPKFLLCHWQITPLSFWKHPVVIVETFKVKVYLTISRHFPAQPFCPVLVLAFALQLFSSLHLCLAPFLGSLIVLQFQYWSSKFWKSTVLDSANRLVKSVSSAIMRCQSYLQECVSRGGLLHYSEWIFSLPKLLINSFAVESSWGCFRRFQQMLQVGIRCPRPVPTQVKCKNPSIKRWDSAKDTTVILQIHPKSQLLINSHQTSTAEAPNIAGTANRAYRPWGGPYTTYMYCRCCCWCSVAAVQPSQPADIRNGNLPTHHPLD